MRLERYISEETSPFDTPGYDMEKKVTIVKKDCKPFFKENTSGKFLYRGTNKIIGEIEKIVPREDRRPSDMPQVIHDRLNKLFKKKVSVASEKWCLCHFI